MERIKYVVAYMRYSSENQRDGYSIEAQKAAIEAFCQQNGYNIVHFYKDEAKTGTLDSREEFQQMIADAAEGNFQAVIVHKFDRFSRDKYDNAIYKRELRNNGVRVISVLEPLDDSPESLILETLLEGMAQYYSENLSREIKKGLGVKALLAKHCGGVAPYGYKVNKETSDFEIEPTEAEVVRKVFDLYVNGMPVLEIANHLNALGLKTRINKTRGGKDFTPQMVRGILSNEKYNGTFVYRKTKKVKSHGRLKTVKQSGSDIIVLDDKIPKIVEYDLWIAAQKRLKANTYNTTRAKVEYLLDGFMFCGECGSPFVGGGSVPKYKNGVEVGRYNFYICKKKRKSHDCTAPQINKDRIEGAVIQGIIDYCYNDESIELFADDFAKWWEQHGNDNKAEIARYKDELKRLEAQKARIVSLALDDVLTPVEAKERKKEIEVKIATIEPKIRQFETPNIPSKKEIVRFMKDTKAAIQSGAFDDYRALIRQHLTKVEVFNDCQVITLKKVPYMVEPEEADVRLPRRGCKKTIDSECNTLQEHSVSIVNEPLPKELTITLKLERGKRVAYLVA